MPLKRTIAGSHTVPNDAKRKAPAVDLDLDWYSDDSVSNDRSRDQSTLFVTPAPAPPRKRVAETLKDISAARAVKRGRAAASTPMQATYPPRPTIEIVEDGVEDQIHQSDRRSQHAANRQPDPVGTSPPQGSKNAQPGDSGARAASSAEPANTTIDLTGINDEEDEGDSVPPAQPTLHRSGIAAPPTGFRKAIRDRCRVECERAASTLECRTDVDGREIYQRCIGTVWLLNKAKTLTDVRKIMTNDVKGVLLDADATLCNERDHFNRIFDKINNTFDKQEAKKILDRRVARVEVVDQVRNFRKSVVNDLNELPRAVLRRNIRC